MADEGSKPKDTPIDSASAASRLSQISGHLEPSSSNNSNTRRKRKTADVLPADWSDVTSKLEQLRTIARTPPIESKSYIRQKTSGKLWARERLDSLLDEGSFHEVGSVSGTVSWVNTRKGTVEGEQQDIESFIPSNNIQGMS